MDSSRCRTYLTFLREARELALKDSENFDALIQAFERIGSTEKGNIGNGLNGYKAELMSIAKRSPLGLGQPAHFHINADKLFDLVRIQRNEAMHQGIVARNLVRHCVEFCLIIEHALMNDENVKTAADLMVRNVCFAESDHPISYIRQQMLVNAFSYLPILQDGGRINFLSDVTLAKWLRPMEFKVQSEVLAKTLKEILSGNNRPMLIDAKILPSKTSVKELAAELDHAPILLSGPGGEQDIVGLISAFDLL